MSESSQHKPTVERYAEAELPSRFGPFQVVVYRELGGDKEHLAVIAGEVDGAEDLLIRVHSECLTGEALHSLRCDCRDQLDLALERIQSPTRSRTRASTRSTRISRWDSKTTSAVTKSRPTCSATSESAPLL